MSGKDRTKINMPSLAFEARVSSGTMRRVPSGVLLESGSSRLVRVGPNEATDETPSFILLYTEAVEAAAALLGWTPPPKHKMVTGEQLATEARLGVIGPGPLRHQLQADEAGEEIVVDEIFGGSVIDHDPGDEMGGVR